MFASFQLQNVKFRASHYLVLWFGETALSSTKKKKDKKEEKPVKLEDVAEETGELLGKGLKKTWNVLKSFGEGVADAVEMKEEPEEASVLNCANCGASVPHNSSFCAKCGKKL